MASGRLVYPYEHTATVVVPSVAKTALTTRIAASAEIKASAGVVYAVDLLANAGAATVILRDTDATGDIIGVVGASGANVGIQWFGPRYFSVAIYAVVTGTPSHVVVHYE